MLFILQQTIEDIERPRLVCWYNKRNADLRREYNSKVYSTEIYK